MTTAEAKPEAMEENSLPPNSKIWVLRVSIHCEGCKKKVIKILNKIQGVYRVEVDVKQRKVTVVGNLDVETVIRSLEKKTGKKVELWPQPEKASRREKKQSKESPDNEDNKWTATVEEKNELGPPTESAISSKKGENGGGSKDGGSGGEDGENGVQVKETAEVEAKTEVKQSEITVQVADKAAPETADEKSESGGSGEKGMKGQNGNNTNGDNVEEGDGEGTKESSRSGQTPPSHASMYPSPGSTRVRARNEYSSPFPNLNPPPHVTPVYTVSYYASYPPESNYGASYYDPPPPTISYEYTNPSRENEVLPYNPYPNVDESSVFDRFSDDNPNACSIM